MKKFAFILLCLCMILVSCTSNASQNAVGTVNLTELTYTGSGVSVNKQTKTVEITSNGVYTLSGELNGGTIIVNADKNAELIFDGISVTSTDGPAIIINNPIDATITLKEGTKNYIKDSEQYDIETANGAIYSSGNLTINGSGSLEVNGIFEHGISCDGSLSIADGNITLNSKKHGFNVKNVLQIDSGVIKVVTQEGKGMKAKGEVVINGGDVDIKSIADEGLESKGLLTINDGNINIDAFDDGINAGSSDSSQNESGNEAENSTPEFEIPEDSATFESDNFKEHKDIRPMPEDGKKMEKPEISEGEFPKSDKGPRPEGKIPGFEDGEFPEFPEGETPEIPDGEFPKSDRGPRPEGKMPEFKDGEFPEGEIPEFTDGEFPEFTDGKAPAQREFNGGQTPPMGFGGFGNIDEETASAHAITINGGTIYIKSGGDGIDSNGNLIINGGEIMIEGPVTDGDGPLDSDGLMNITGGKVTTLSSAGMVQLPKGHDSQSILSIILNDKQKSGTVISIREAETDTEIMNTTSAIDFSAIIYSDKIIDAEKEYHLYLDGEFYSEISKELRNNFAGFGRGFGSFDKQNNKEQQ